MMMIQFYKNPVHHPNYKYTITPSGPELFAKPVQLQTKSGTITVSANFEDLFQANYIRIRKGSSTLWGWIADVRSMGRENSWEVEYHVDPMRTYFSAIDWGKQYVVRDMTPTQLQDPLLGSTQHYLNYRSTKLIMNGSANEYKRVYVIVIRPSGEANTVRSSIIPTMPNGYVYFIREYDIRNPQNAGGITTFVEKIASSAPDPRLVSAYSVPYFDISKFDSVSTLSDYASWSDMIGAFGVDWKVIGRTTGKTLTSDDLVTTLHVGPQTLPTYYKRVPHQARIIVPGAGILPVSDYMMEYGFTFRRDMDFFTGACNYMLMRVGGDGAGPDGQSVRSSPISNLPIIGDPKDVYMTQNQNGLTTALLGDVAMIGGGILTTMLGMPTGPGAILQGVGAIGERSTRLRDLENQSTSPPAMLAPALVHNFNDTAFLDISYKDCTNETMVHDEAGYPQHVMKAITPPASGYLQTMGCNINSTGAIPQWAIDQINTQLDSGIMFYT